MAPLVFFSTHALHVVPTSPRAWCTTARHGVLKRGGYGEHINPRDSLGKLCRTSQLDRQAA
jgi:hypothetical protein